MIVKEQKSLEFDNRANAIFERTQLELAILMKLVATEQKPVARVKRIFMWGKYPAISLHGKKYHLHRFLMEYWNGDISKWYVDHINGNKLDARGKNLRLLEPSEHQRITNTGRKQTVSHVNKRIDSTTKTRYGHPIYENPELLEGGDHAE